MKEKVLISACLIGSNCKYSGGNNCLDENVLSRLKEKYDLIPVCPETAGGLSIPRDPSERLGDKVVSNKGRDVTEEFSSGADIAVTLAERFNCRTAVLKERSPSCGSHMIYDGTFTGTAIPGRGLAAEKLYNRGIKIMSENEVIETVETAEAAETPVERPALKDILAACDHTLLRVDCTADEIKTLCDQAIKYNCASVCIPPCHVAGAKRYVGNKLPICTVIGFPNGYMTSSAKAYEAADAIRNGADEIDMVINLSMVKDACWDDVAKDIKTVRDATKGHILKVIIETCLLTQDEKLKLCEIVSASGADFIKTSTGFSKGGATFEDVKLMRENCPADVKVKAAGGISSLEDAEKFMLLGAERLGTSRIVKIAIAEEEKAAAQQE